MTQCIVKDEATSNRPSSTYLFMYDPTKQTIDALTHMDLPAGVDIEIKL